jgi:aminocarboxymuconate-semialdehyde decarboxylase
MTPVSRLTLRFLIAFASIGCRSATPTSRTELNCAAGKPGLRAVHLPDSIDNRDYLFQPEFAPLLARIEALGYPILFHNLNSDLFGRRPADAGLDNTFAHAMLASKFISTGTLDKFPKLEIVLPHAGGAFPVTDG